MLKWWAWRVHETCPARTLNVRARSLAFGDFGELTNGKRVG